MQPVPPRNKRLMIDRPMPINKKKKKTPLKPPVKGKYKPYPMPRFGIDRPNSRISQGGIGNKEVNPIYRNQGF